MSTAAKTSEGADEAEARHRAELDAQREEFHRELSRRALRIGELEEEMVELAREFEGSLSWRLTRPVRSLGRLLARRRG
ncbi:MAG TPA: hypothetical protein VH703_06795 [Solirubrobacterales bacterium]|jgi:hypothetical protein